ncbi:MAG: SDR family oxidoreductase [Planctomycetales bacterium]
MNQSRNRQLEGRVAAVTGSSSGIGKAVALELAAHGARVVVHARKSQAAAEQTAEEIRSLGSDSLVLLQDLQDPAAHEELVERAWNWQGKIDAWVNNAGADLLTGEAADWSFDRKLRRLLDVDVTATIRVARLIGARMKQRGSGVILNMGWDQAATGMAGDSGELFAAAKGAVAAFSKSLALSLAPEVRVNCLAPGWIQTAWGDNASDQWQQRAVNESALGRWGTPQDVAGVACFLASPGASFVTGQTIPVNGGWKAS